MYVSTVATSFLLVMPGNLAFVLRGDMFGKDTPK